MAATNHAISAANTAKPIVTACAITCVLSKRAQMITVGMQSQAARLTTRATSLATIPRVAPATRRKSGTVGVPSAVEVVGSSGLPKAPSLDHHIRTLVRAFRNAALPFPIVSGIHDELSADAELPS